MVLRPDPATLRVAPGFKTPTAYVFADAYHTDGSPWSSSPRQVLKTVMALYAERGWRPVIAPELEFYLTALNPDPDLPADPAGGRSGQAGSSPQPSGLEAVTEYDDIIETIYEYAETAGLDVDTMIHESGTAQLEINFLHGEPVQLADQVQVFKRIVRQVALQHGVYATFMAKPMEHQPGSAMHLHVSMVDEATGENLFADASGEDSATFRHFVGGLQTFLRTGRSRCCSRPTSTPSAACGRATRRRSMCSGATTTARAACACRSRTGAIAASRTACPAPTPAPIWRWPPP